MPTTFWPQAASSEEIRSRCRAEPPRIQSRELESSDKDIKAVAKACAGGSTGPTVSGFSLSLSLEASLRTQFSLAKARASAGESTSGAGESGLIRMQTRQGFRAWAT